MLSTKKDVRIENVNNNDPNEANVQQSVYRKINSLLGYKLDVYAPQTKLEALRTWGQLLAHLKDHGSKDTDQLVFLLEMIIGIMIEHMERGESEYHEFMQNIIDQIYDQPDLLRLVYGAIFNIVKKEHEDEVTFDQVYEIYKRYKNEFDSCQNYTCKIWPMQFDDPNAEEIKSFKALAKEQNIKEITKKYGAGVEAVMNIYDSLRGSDIGQEVYAALKKLKIGEISSEPIVIKGTGANNAGGIIFVQLIDVQKLDVNPRSHTPNITAALADRNIAEYIKDIRTKYFNAETLKQALGEEDKPQVKKPKTKKEKEAANKKEKEKEHKHRQRG